MDFVHVKTQEEQMVTLQGDAWDMAAPKMKKKTPRWG